MSFETGLLVALAMLLGNAFFVGAEFALVSARRSNMELKAVQGSAAAKLTLTAMEQVSLMLAGAQFGITLCSLVFGAVGEPLIAHLLAGPFHTLGITDTLIEPISLLLALCLMVYLHVVIGEMVPKNLALAEPTRSALLLVPSLFFVVRSTKPIIVTLNAVANACVRALGVKPRQEIASSFSRDEVAGFVKESHREGLLSEEEEHLLTGTLNFDERTAKSVVLVLDKVIVTSPQPTPLEIEHLTTQTGFSRFPVPDQDGKLTGYVHLKDILQIPDSKHETPLAPRFIRPLVNVKASLPLRDALAAMQRSGAHIAQVTGTHEQVIGVIMLEDVLEQLVGAIRDDTQKQ